MAEIQLIISRIAECKSVIGASSSDAEAVIGTIGGQQLGTRCSVGGAKDLLTLLFHDVRPPDELLASLRAFAGYFYPTDRGTDSDLIKYYKQREWRIVANSVLRGQPMDRTLTEDEQRTLLELDPDFFSRNIPLPNSRSGRLLDSCRCFSEFQGRSAWACCNRLIVPQEAYDGTVELIRTLDCDISISVESKDDVSSR
jgi:hypothetical protein